MEILLLKKVTPELVSAFKELIPQLSGDITAPTFKDLTEIVSSKNVLLFIAEENGEIVGTLTLVIYRIPTGMKAWIEDVVVDKRMRGKGIGRLLTQFVIDYAKQINIPKVDLTSRPDRIAANELYKRMGFLKRDTNVYRLEIND